MIFIDSTSLKWFLRCKEGYRRNQVENVVNGHKGVHLLFGIAFHESIDRFWRGVDFDTNLGELCGELQAVSMAGYQPPDVTTWQRLVNIAPDMLAAYHDYYGEPADKIYQIDGKPLIEHEWVVEEPFGISGIALCGRMDRVERGPVLVDSKTASARTRTWKADFKRDKLMDTGLSLYDWYLCQIGHTPQMVTVEAVTKPYKDGEVSQVVRVDLPELMAYRKRFDMLLKWNLSELKHYWASYTGIRPWPMGVECVHKFGCCEYMDACLGKKCTLVPREEHLDCRKLIQIQ